MKLIEPTMEYDAPIQAYKNEFSPEMSMDGSGGLRDCESTAEWLKQVERFKNPKTVPKGKVQATQYLYLREEDQKVVGVIQIRHTLNEVLATWGGHIGYSVASSERRQGYATEMLALALQKCKELGILRVLVTCYPENEGSRKTILKNGGVYESTVYVDEIKKEVERYWIDLSEKS
ncbi:MAG: GNAT family N-acetyltransferase [Clostridia bacterium]|nr:GNAT family N-acetyltransferase [Clostridia bacterium]